MVDETEMDAVRDEVTETDGVRDCEGSESDTDGETDMDSVIDEVTDGVSEMDEDKDSDSDIDGVSLTLAEIDGDAV